MRDLVETAFFSDRLPGPVNQSGIHVDEGGDGVLIDHLTHNDTAILISNGVHGNDADMGRVDCAVSPLSFARGSDEIPPQIIHGDYLGRKIRKFRHGPDNLPDIALAHYFQILYIPNRTHCA